MPNLRRFPGGAIKRLFAERAELEMQAELEQTQVGMKRLNSARRRRRGVRTGSEVFWKQGVSILIF
jgi:hypothetical protein